MFEAVNLAVAGETVEKIFKIQLSGESEMPAPRRRTEQLIYNESEESDLSQFAGAAPARSSRRSSS